MSNLERRVRSLILQTELAAGAAALMVLACLWVGTTVCVFLAGVNVGLVMAFLILRFWNQHTLKFIHEHGL